MWSDSWASEEHGSGTPRAFARTWTYITSAACGIVLLGEMGVGALTVALEFGRRPASLPRGIVALALALAGPYAAVLMWRSRRERTRGRSTLLGRTALVAGVIGMLSIGGLVLLLLTLPLVPFVPGIHAGAAVPWSHVVGVSL